MRPVHLAGRGLASSLGLDLDQALASLRRGGNPPAVVTLPGPMGGDFPFHAIPFSHGDWNERARTLVQRVATEAGAQQARAGALFIATSSFDIGAVERGGEHRDYAAFCEKVAGWLDWTGPVHAISTACTSSLNALVAAQAQLDAGREEEALVLGVELDNRLTPGGFAALQLLSRTACRPFGAQRDGLVLGEAVAALRLSTREPARWKLLGGANVVDGSQPTGAASAAVAHMVRRALAASGLSATQIDLVKVQAAGSPGNDAAEAQGLRDAFEVMPPLVSLKPELGHTMGASGAAEIALLTASLEQDVWPRNGHEPDAGLQVALASAMPEKARRIMATILGFGGSHASVVLERT